jgi:AcrR family transcriptional regulator
MGKGDLMPKQPAKGFQDKKKKRRTPNSEETRQAILQAALDLFLEKGYAETSVDEIARKASLAKGTIFFHFKTKLGLLLEVFRSLSRLEEDFSGSDTGIEKSYQKGWAVEDVMKYTATKTFEHGEKKSALRRLWMLEALRLKGKEGLFYRELVQRPATPLEEFMMKRQKEGVFREFDPYIVSLAFFGSLFAIRLWHEQMQGNKIRPLSQEKVIEEITNLFLNGLMVEEKGRE